MLDPKGPEADAGIYLRGTPQVQIWDTSRVNVGAQVGSGGLYNNQVNESKPSKVADNKLGEWNSFYIKMVGDRVTVVLAIIMDMTAPHARKSEESSFTPKTSLTASAAVSANR